MNTFGENWSLSFSYGTLLKKKKEGHDSTCHTMSWKPLVGFISYFAQMFVFIFWRSVLLFKFFFSWVNDIFIFFIKGEFFFCLARTNCLVLFKLETVVYHNILKVCILLLIYFLEFLRFCMFGYENSHLHSIPPANFLLKLSKTLP